MFTEKRHVFVGGSIGVGKSSVLSAILDNLTYMKCVTYIKEYIDFDPLGTEKLKKHLEGVTDIVTFQRYIMNIYKTQILSLAYQNAQIVIWERHPCEALLFCKKNLNEGKCTQKEYDLIEYEINKMCKEFDIPPLKDLCVTFTPMVYDTLAYDIKFIGKAMVEAILRTANESRTLPIYCFLFCSDSYEQMGRVIARGRQCEIDNYTPALLLQLNNEYLEFMEGKIPKLARWKKEGKINMI